MAMAQEQEIPSEESEEQPEKDPVDERFSKIEARIGEINVYNRSVANHLGYIGRQMTQLVSQPHTAATEAKIDALRQELEGIRLAGMDAEEKTNYLLERRRTEELKSKTEAPAPPSQVEHDPWQETYGPLLVEDAAEQDVDYNAAIKETDWPIELNLSRTNPYLDFYKRAKKVIDRLADEKQRAKTPPPRTDATRGSGTPKGGLENYRKALRESGQLPSAAEIDRLTAKYVS